MCMDLHEEPLAAGLGFQQLHEPPVEAAIRGAALALLHPATRRLQRGEGEVMVVEEEGGPLRVPGDDPDPATRVLLGHHHPPVPLHLQVQVLPAAGVMGHNISTVLVVVHTEPLDAPLSQGGEQAGHIDILLLLGGELAVVKVSGVEEVAAHVSSVMRQLYHGCSAVAWDCLPDRHRSYS